jgi:hypothetical protein
MSDKKEFPKSRQTSPTPLKQPQKPQIPGSPKRGFQPLEQISSKPPKTNKPSK